LLYLDNITVTMPRFSQLALLAVVAASTAVVSDAFAVVPRSSAATTAFQTSSRRSLPVLCLSDESKESAEAAVFMPADADADAAEDEDYEVDLDTVEGLGRGAAKVRFLVVYGTMLLSQHSMHAPGYHPRDRTGLKYLK
jgi:hypothetical protein